MRRVQFLELGNELFDLSSVVFYPFRKLRLCVVAMNFEFYFCDIDTDVADFLIVLFRLHFRMAFV